ncbi:MAG: (2Fe-2S)-binding protein [Phycisphaerales bacterium]|nr:(2Fe-2S)-binding protein [Phycisphaerales bacterium]MCB9835339.1 (2Fe-2S)-binding protein [Phycisphaera sp.]
MAVDRCVCHNVTLAELKAMSTKATTVDELSAKTRCCTGCGMCKPYVILMLRTGRTSFPVLPPHEAQRIAALRD